jgi:hypothetical protein
MPDRLGRRLDLKGDAMNRIRRLVPWALVTLSAIFALLGLGDVTWGIAFEPTTALAITGKTVDEIRAESPAAFTVIDYIYRGGGITLTLFTTLMTVVLAIPYRRGEWWSWWAAWLLPIWASAVFLLFLVQGTAPGQAISGVAWSGVVFAVVIAILLLIDRARFAGPVNAPTHAPELTVSAS